MNHVNAALIPNLYAVSMLDNSFEQNIGKCIFLKLAFIIIIIIIALVSGIVVHIKLQQLLKKRGVIEIDFNMMVSIKIIIRIASYFKILQVLYGKKNIG